MTKLQQIIRHGAYGVVLHNSQILLTQKKSGPYCGLWGLPGGMIEFGETPENTVIREVQEETALAVEKMEFFDVTTSTGEYTKDGVPYGFHHVGILYNVLSWTEKVNIIPEEKIRWVNLRDIVHKELTPFARHTISKLTR